MAETLNILCIGAHPDDNEINTAGLCARLAARGHRIYLVSVTNGDKGHFAPEYIADPTLLAARRLVEGNAAAAHIGASYQTLGVHDGEVYVDKSTTEALVRCIRSTGEPGRGPDLVLFNRTVDYHRDHRYTAQMVVDATYMLTVPMLCPDTRHLDHMPVFATWYDDFRDQIPFRCDVSVGIDSVFETKVDMVCAHESQFFEWLPYNAGVLDQVPPDFDGRRQRVWDILDKRARHRASQSASAPHRGTSGIDRAEAYQLCEYGRQPTDTQIRTLFALDD
jgi:LmbE family N-acetylglucosaminyl deacetylase